MRFARGSLSITLLFFAFFAFPVALLGDYGSSHVLDGDAVANAAARTLDNQGVRALIAEEVSAQIIDQVPALAGEESAVRSALDNAVQTEEFRSAFKKSASRTIDEILSANDGDAVLTLGDFGKIARDAVSEVNPDLAAQIPEGGDIVLLDLGDSGNAKEIADFADAIHSAGTIATLIALLLAVASIFVAPDRRKAIRRVGVAMFVLGVAMFVLLGLLKSTTVNGFIVGDQRDAANNVWDQFLGGLRRWFIFTFVLGAVTVIAATVAKREPDERPPSLPDEDPTSSHEAETNVYRTRTGLRRWG